MKWVEKDPPYAAYLDRILPEMSIDESLVVTRVFSVADQFSPGMPLIRHRPFRSPHHTISHAGLVGGGNIPKPGESRWRTRLWTWRR